MMDFDATTSYPSAMWHENSVFPKRKTGFAFELHMNNINIGAFNIQIFNQHGNQSAILKVKDCDPTDLIFHCLPIK